MNDLNDDFEDIYSTNLEQDVEKITEMILPQDYVQDMLNNSTILSDNCIIKIDNEIKNCIEVVRKSTYLFTTYDSNKHYRKAFLYKKLVSRLNCIKLDYINDIKPDDGHSSFIKKLVARIKVMLRLRKVPKTKKEINLALYITKQINSI